MVAPVKEYPVVWLQGSTCTGCSISVLNSTSPTIKNLLVDEVVPGKHLSLRYHATIMAGAGEVAWKALQSEIGKGGYLLVVEGAIPAAAGGVYGHLGEKSILAVVEEAARAAAAVIALGTCASFGGIPAAAPNPSGCIGMEELLDRQGLKVPLVNVPGCPPHPDWFVGTVAALLLGDLQLPPLDDLKRPLAFYGSLIHENCPRRAYFDEGKFAKQPGEPGCLYYVGCKGPVTYSDCPKRLWNGGTNWCIGTGAPCQGCTQPEFPDLVAPFYQKTTDADLPAIA
ncbi:MAG: hydrogenase small subunit [Clostridia bacterium]|nr:hydrogenase small subunit [Clostridia bacterium]